MFAVGQNGNPAYRIFNKKGNEIKFKKFVKKIDEAQVILFGELHNNSIIHWLQLETTQALNQKVDLILGAEMFEADNQEQLNQYLAGEITQKGLDTLAQLWSNYKTDYAPLVNFAKENNLPFVATNIPRKFANKVYHQGWKALDSLSEKQLQWVAPLPIPYDSTLSSYAEMVKMMPGHGGENLAKAQAIKDATMAYFISQNLQPETTFLHFNGTFHSKDYQGIYWYLNQYLDNPSLITISVSEQEETKKLNKELLGTADYIIVVPIDMTKTY